MDSTESTLVPGYRLDRYELLCPIASGGMASVWLARLRGKGGFEKLFAIKTIKADLVWDSNLQEMFLDEARIASRIHHPNVAQILELGEQDGILYIVMEWIDGDSLSQLSRLALKRKAKLPLAVSLRILADVCAGLHAAHQLKERGGDSLGVVHRDVSPQNILVTKEGTAKVIDFGLAKARNRTAGPTQSGIVKGKIRYMAPEQVEATAIDHRVDVWAAGMCLYELVAGHIPYDGEDDLQVVKRLMSTDPLPRFEEEAMLPEIEELLRRALVLDPDGRFESCAAMKRAIEGAMHDLDLRTGHEEVAEYIAKILPDLAAKRAKTVAKAIEAADARETRTIEPPPESHTGEALQLLTRRRSEEPSEPPPESKSASRTTSARSLKEQLGVPQKRSGMTVWLVTGLAVAGVGGWILWPQANGTPQVPTTPPAHSTPAASAPPPPASASEMIELDTHDAAVAKPTSNATRPPTHTPVVVSSSVATADAAPAAPTYNPAWSILTNPPASVMLSANPPPSAAPPASAPAPEPPPRPVVSDH